jgi:hypothetical protein
VTIASDGGIAGVGAGADIIYFLETFGFGILGGFNTNCAPPTALMGR